MYPLHLANGVVGVRAMWGPENASACPTEHRPRREAVTERVLREPHHSRTNPHLAWKIAVADAAQARAAVDRYQANGADFIKVYDGRAT